jgi:hypothetical protein
VGVSFTIDAQWRFRSEREAKAALAVIDALLEPTLTGTVVEVHAEESTTYLHATELFETVTRAGAKAQAGRADLYDLDAGVLYRARPTLPPIAIRRDPEIAEGEPRSRIVHPERIAALALHDGWLATGGAEKMRLKRSPPDAPVWGGSACVWELETGARLGRFAEGATIRELTFSPDGQLLAVSRPGEHDLQVWAWREERMVARAKAGGPVHWSPDGTCLVTMRQLSRGSRGIVFDVAADRVRETLDDGGWALFYRDPVSVLRHRPSRGQGLLELVGVGGAGVPEWRREDVRFARSNRVGSALLIGRQDDLQIVCEVIDLATLDVRASLRLEGRLETALTASTHGWVIIESGRGVATWVLDDGTVASSAAAPGALGRQLATDGRSLVGGTKVAELQPIEVACRPTWFEISGQRQPNELLTPKKKT